VSVISVLRGLRQEDEELKARPRYVARPQPDKKKTKRSIKIIQGS
jgi:hypothetical protein